MKVPQAKLLNLGCGTTYHRAWTNIDMLPAGLGVQVADLREPLPFPDSNFDAVYHSHVLEHFGKEEGARFLRECFRVLRPGGILRVAVPDLEGIARAYLRALEAADRGDTSAAHDYDWVMLELFDQCVRDRSGGLMRDWLAQEKIPNEAFVASRVGQELDAVRSSLRTPQTGLKEKLKGKSPARLLGLAVGKTARVLSRALPGKLDRQLSLGRFRESGEVHRWMYDRFSLKRLLLECGGMDVKLCSATESRIPGFSLYELDTAGGRVRKPDSLFMEAAKA